MTTPFRIDQILAGFADGDAISTEAAILRDAFQKMGAESDIYVVPERVSPHISTPWKPLSEYKGGASDVVVHHYSIASDATDLFLSCRAKKVLVYHNITPATYFAGYDDEVAATLRKARNNLKNVAGAADAVWAVSRFNASELTEVGVKDAKVFPLLFRPRALDLPPEPMVMQKFSVPMSNILFVGRIAPNKCIEELILAFAWYHKCMNPFSRLIIVGSERSAPRYFAMLRMLAGELDLSNVCFERFASPAGLVAYYELADVFVSPSRHEGYCLPLVEAMYKHVPVIARNAGGMSEALDGGGVLYEDLNPAELAELLRKVLEDRGLASEILDSQKAPMERILGRSLEKEVTGLLGDLIP